MPGEGQTEADFIKTILWSYVLWFEACQPVGRFLMLIVRNTSPENHKSASRAFLNLNNLRTSHAHNLLQTSKSDQRKLEQARTWLASNGGNEADWARCTSILSAELAAAIDVIREHWQKIMQSGEDREAAILSPTDTIEREWEPHVVDAIVSDVATSIGLESLDVVRYRSGGLDEWRKAVELFSDRESAEAALRRIIRQEMVAKFGASPIEAEASEREIP